MANKDTSKQWFETGDYPTQVQFAQVFDWLRWKDEQLEVADVNGLAGLVNSVVTLAQVKALFLLTFSLDADGSYDLPAGTFMFALVAIAAADFNISVGTAPGGNDIIDGLTPRTPGTPEPVIIPIYAEAARTLHFSNIGQHFDFLILKIPTL